MSEKDNKRKDEKDDGKEKGWMDGTHLIVDHEAKNEVKDYKDVDLVAYQKEEVKEWDMSSVSKEYDWSRDEKVITMDNVKVVGVDGIHEIDHDGHKYYDKEKENVEEVSKEELERMAGKQLKEVKRNRKEYGIFCPDCKNTLKCRKCSGKGKRGLLRRPCKICRGSGRCRTCKGNFKVQCPQCSKFISGFSLNCRFCGKKYRCIECSQPMPLMATKCISCRAEYLCLRCKSKVNVMLSSKCRKCGIEV